MKLNCILLLCPYCFALATFSPFIYTDTSPLISQKPLPLYFAKQLISTQCFLYV